MGKFKVGDKVRVVDANRIICRRFKLTDGKEYEVLSFHEKNGTSVEHIKITTNSSSSLPICDYEYKYIELVESKPTKNQRITALEEHSSSSDKRVESLEKEVSELKLIVHELRDKKVVPSTDAKDIIEFEGSKYRKVDREAQEGDLIICKDQKNKKMSLVNDGGRYLVGAHRLIKDTEINVYNQHHNRTTETVDVYELIAEEKPMQVIGEIKFPVAKTPNQQRAQIIEDAKRFIEEHQDDYFHVEVDNDKRTVFVWKLITEGKLYTAITGLATCHQNDVFNEFIGTSIALGRALGLDVSEFEQAVQPTVAVGQTVEVLDTLGNSFGNINDVVSVKQNGCPEFKGSWASNYKIINDTNAIYGGVE